MSEILITGFEMPSKDDTYGLHLVIYPNGDVWIAYDDKPTGKAKEVPPHGRLGDLDKVEGRMHNHSKSCRENGNREKAEIWEHAEQEVRLQGTIIEASN